MPHDTYRQNGAAIRHSRCERDIKPGEMAKQVGVARRTLTAIESDRKQAGWELLYRLKRALDVPLDALLSDAGRKEVARARRVSA